jgi:hypothetical protein
VSSTPSSNLSNFAASAIFNLPLQLGGLGANTLHLLEHSENKMNLTATYMVEQATRGTNSDLLLI